MDVVYLGTGFIIRYEYLERGGILQRRPGTPLPASEQEKWPGVVSTDLYREHPGRLVTCHDHLVLIRMQYDLYMNIQCLSLLHMALHLSFGAET